MTLMKSQRAFTIVELLVVIVVIGILAAITIVSYSGIANRSNIASLQSDLANSSKKLELYYALYDTYPDMSAPDSNGILCPISPVDKGYCIQPSTGTTFSYAKNSNPDIAYVLIATKGSLSYKISKGTAPIANNLPSMPTISSVTPDGNTKINLNWTAPSFDGGSAITGYKIYRGTASGSLTLAYTIGNVLSYLDNSGISGGNTYYYQVRAFNANGDGVLAVESNSGLLSNLASGTGGTQTTDGGYKVHTFTSNGTFNVASSGVVDVLLVGGGGGGGGDVGQCTYLGGGGGGGGVVYSTNYSVTSGDAIPVTVGYGGPPRLNGSDSIFGSLSALGGGGGRYSFGKPDTGGSGAGANGRNNTASMTQVGGDGTIGQGNNGGTAQYIIPVSFTNSGAAGGGGGAGSVGGNYNGVSGGAGGAGLLYFGSYYGGGGGGAGPTTGGVGGLGGGATGSKAFGATAGNGVPNTGGGGGGGPSNCTGEPGYGGSGIVIVRYVSS